MNGDPTGPCPGVADGDAHRRAQPVAFSCWLHQEPEVNRAVVSSSRDELLPFPAG